MYLENIILSKLYPPKLALHFLHLPYKDLPIFDSGMPLNKYLGGIDTFYSPYIRLHGKFEIKPAFQRDILPENNTDLELIPQIITKDADEFLYVAKFVQELGYKELNWNLGCPYPMVAKRGMGSGLINDPAKIDSILKRVFSESEILVSMKMRTGYNDSGEILHVLPILEKYPIKNIAIHPRIGKQLYKEKVDLDSFQRCIESTNHKIHYNGDITSVSKFHDSLFEEYSQALSGPNHIIMRMLHFWNYFIASFPESPKGLKKIKKARTLIDYKNAVNEILNKSSNQTTMENPKSESGKVILVTKASGEKEPFMTDKLIGSLQRAGASVDLINEIAQAADWLAAKDIELRAEIEDHLQNCID